MNFCPLKRRSFLADTFNGSCQKAFLRISTKMEDSAGDWKLKGGDNRQQRWTARYCTKYEEDGK